MTRLIILVGLLAVVQIIRLFRRPIVLALTRRAVATGRDKETIERMPDEIHLVENGGPAADAKATVDLLRGLEGLELAGSYSIRELPRIFATLFVDRARHLLVVVESAQPIGAYVNVHALYASGRVVSFTNTELPMPPKARANVTRNRIPKCPPKDLVARARALPAGEARRGLDATSAPRLYEELYAAEMAFRKQSLATPAAS